MYIRAIYGLKRHRHSGLMLTAAQKRAQVADRGEANDSRSIQPCFTYVDFGRRLCIWSSVAFVSGEGLPFCERISTGKATQ